MILFEFTLNTTSQNNIIIKQNTIILLVLIFMWTLMINFKFIFLRFNICCQHHHWRIWGYPQMTWQCALSSTICDNELVKKKPNEKQDVYASQQFVKVEVLYLTEKRMLCQQHYDNILNEYCSCIGNICMLCLACCLNRLLGIQFSLHILQSPNN